MAFMFAFEDSNVRKKLGRTRENAIRLIAQAVKAGPIDTLKRAELKHTKGLTLKKIGFHKRAVLETIAAIEEFPKDEFRQDLFSFTVDAIDAVSPSTTSSITCRVELDAESGFDRASWPDEREAQNQLCRCLHWAALGGRPRTLPPMGVQRLGQPDGAPRLAEGPCVCVPGRLRAASVEILR